jgi:hypothetical protein
MMTGKLLAAFALMTAFPLASQAQTMSIDNTFVASTTGNSTIAVGDTIQFEVSVTVEAEFNLLIGTMSLAGDITSTLDSNLASDWAGVENEVTGWEWNFVSPGEVKYPSTGTMTPAFVVYPAGPGRKLASQYGFFPEGEGQTSDGSTRVLGWVTITATTPGDFLGGAFMYPLVDIFGGVDPPNIFSPINGASFTVVAAPAVPALSASQLALLGIALLAVGAITLSMHRSRFLRPGA